jgi:hypothetical protein
MGVLNGILTFEMKLRVSICNAICNEFKGVMIYGEILQLKDEELTKIFPFHKEAKSKDSTLKSLRTLLSPNTK